MNCQNLMDFTNIKWIILKPNGLNKKYKSTSCSTVTLLLYTYSCLQDMVLMQLNDIFLVVFSSL